MESNSGAMRAQYSATWRASSVLVLVTGIKVDILHHFGQPAFAEACKGSFPEHITQTGVGLGQVGVVPQPRSECYRQPGLVRVNLPGMNVSDDGQPLLPGAADSEPGIPLGQKAEISATGYGHAVVPDPKSREWVLYQRAGRGLNAKRGAGRGRDAVPVMMDGKDAGVVSES